MLIIFFFVDANHVPNVLLFLNIQAFWFLVSTENKYLLKSQKKKKNLGENPKKTLERIILKEKRKIEYWLFGKSECSSHVQLSR